MQNGRLKGLERKFHTFVSECFCVLYCLTQPVCTTSDGFNDSFMFKILKLKRTQHVSALDTVTVKGKEEMETNTHRMCRWLFLCVCVCVGESVYERESQA